MVAENIKNIQENAKNACFRVNREPNSVTLVAVSKTFPAEKISEAMEAGIFDFGENYVQELLGKKTVLPDSRIRWHFIGHLQSNKVKYIADWVQMIHSVDSESVVKEIQKHAAKRNKNIDVLVEINTSEESTKFGVTPDRAIDFIRLINGLPNVCVQGLMTIGPFGDTAEESRSSFRLLRSIFDEVNATKILSQPMKHLSMGMTHDFETAIEEGATLIRIGTAIFGLRQKSD